MTEAAPIPSTGRRFFAIAHRAGNNLHALEEALDAGVDGIECDFWHSRGRLELRHERKLPALPVIYDRWYLRFSLGRLRLPALLREINFRAWLFLDIKSSTPRAADAVLDLYRDNQAMMPPSLVSSQRWHLLDKLAEAGTGMRMFYSVGRADQIAQLLLRCDGAHPPTGTSIRHTLVSPATVGALHAAGLQVFAWTVNNPHRGAELLSWGVDGLISDNLDVLKLSP